MKTRQHELSAMLFAASLLLGVPAVATNAPITISVDVNANQHLISPLIYGVNGTDYGITAISQQLSDLRMPIVRQGGEETSRYNWQINAYNHAVDYYFESISIAEDGSAPGTSADNFIGNCKNAGAAPMITIPMLPWIAKLGANRSTLYSFSVAKYGAQAAVDPSLHDAGNGVRPNGSLITGNDPTDANVANSTTIQNGWIQHLINTWGTSTQGGVTYYIMDNEPSNWPSVHRDIHPIGTHTSEYLTDFFSYSALVKAADPSALVVGPEEVDWYSYFYSAYDLSYAAAHNYNGVYPDRSTNGNLDYLPAILSAIHQHDANAGSRSLDVFSVHYYPEGPEYSDDTSASTQLLRNESTRELWDPNYISKNVPVVSTGNVGANVQLIPLVKNWVNTYYPGTKIGITEYSWGADGYIGGATAQADILGILGREGVDLATRYYQPDPSTPTYLSIKMYRNYDSQGSAFGETSVQDTVPNPDLVSSFASIRGSDGALTIMLISKVLAGTTPTTVNLANFNFGSAAQVWQLTSANAINHLSDLALNSPSLQLNLPAQSITLLVIPSNGGNPAKQSQTITFPSVGGVVYNQSVTLTATASSGLPIAYRVISGPATIVGENVTFTGTGSVVLAADQAGDDSYYPATEVRQTVSVGKAIQMIQGFDSIPTHPIGDPPFTITQPTATSSLPVSLSVMWGPAIISGNKVTLTGVGTVILMATQPGNSVYSPAQPLMQSFSVIRADQSITFPSVTNKTTLSQPFTVTAVASSKLPVALTVQSGPAKISGTTVTLTGSGTVVLAANQAGNIYFNPASTVTVSFNVTKVAQTITFPNLPPKLINAPPYPVSATSSSGLYVTISVLSGPAKVVNNVVKLTGLGTVVLAANQPGNARYLAAPTVTQSFTVYNQYIIFAPIPNQLTNSPPFLVSATASSHLPVTITVQSGPATILNNKVTITGAGTVALAADQSGNGTYNPAPTVTRSFVVSLVSQTINFGPFPTRRKVSPPFAVGGSASSHMALTISVYSGPASISGNIVTLNGTVGTVILSATQPGDGIYAPKTVYRAFAVTN